MHQTEGHRQRQRDRRDERQTHLLLLVAGRDVGVAHAAQDVGRSQRVHTLRVGGSAGGGQVLAHVRTSDVAAQLVLRARQRHLVQRAVDGAQLGSDGLHRQHVDHPHAEHLHHKQVLRERGTEHDAPVRGRSAPVRGRPGEGPGQEERAREGHEHPAVDPGQRVHGGGGRGAVVHMAAQHELLGGGELLEDEVLQQQDLLGGDIGGPSTQTGHALHGRGGAGASLVDGGHLLLGLVGLGLRGQSAVVHLAGLVGRHRQELVGLNARRLLGRRVAPVLEEGTAEAHVHQQVLVSHLEGDRHHHHDHHDHDQEHEGAGRSVAAALALARDLVDVPLAQIRVGDSAAGFQAAVHVVVVLAQPVVRVEHAEEHRVEEQVQQEAHREAGPAHRATHADGGSVEHGRVLVVLEQVGEKSSVLLKMKERCEAMPKFVGHGDLSLPNMGVGSIVLDWDNFGFYPPGFDLALGAVLKGELLDAEALNSMVERVFPSFATRCTRDMRWFSFTFFYCVFLYARQAQHKRYVYALLVKRF